MELSLNIYKKENNREIEKTYKTDTVDLMYGTLEDLIAAVDIDKLLNIQNVNKIEVGAMVISLLPKIRPIMKDIFGGITDDEIKRTKVRELKDVFVDAFMYAVEEINGTNDGGGNVGN